MTLHEVVRILNARVLAGSLNLDRQVHSAFGSDMMSDVLAYVKETTLLLTGLVNSQSVRTAGLLDLPCIVYVRGKQPSQDVLDMAEELGMPIINTCYTMYEACGRLYAKGLPSAKIG